MSTGPATNLAVHSLHPDMLHTRAMATTHRIMTGSGKTTLLTIGHFPQLFATALTHGLTASGDLVIAIPPHANSAWHALSTYNSIAVRLLMERELPTPNTRILSALLDLRGSLQLASHKRIATWVERHELPAHLLTAHDVPGTQLATITPTIISLHDVAGVTAIPPAHLQHHHLTIPNAPHDVADETLAELTAHDAVWSFGENYLDRIVTAVLNGTIRGALWQRGICPAHTPERLGLFVSDIDLVGLTLLRISPHQCQTAFAPFPNPLNSLHHAHDAISKLLPITTR